MLNKLLSKRIGQAKEHEAKLWLASHQVRIIDQNVSCKGGEIDLIGELASPIPTIVFFEIKYRASDQFGHPLETLTHSQMQRIRRCAEQYLKKNTQYHQHLIRFDVVAWQGEQAKEWLTNAF